MVLLLIFSSLFVVTDMAGISTYTNIEIETLNERIQNNKEILNTTFSNVSYKNKGRMQDIDEIL